MSLIKIDTRIPQKEDLLMMNGLVALVTNVDLKKRLVWISTTKSEELQKIPLKQYDIYLLESETENPAV